MADEFDDFGGFDDDDGFVPAEMAAADAHGAEEFEDFGDDDFFDDDAEGREGGEGGGGDEDDMDGFEDDDWGSDDGGGAAGGDGDAMDGFGDEEEADSGGAAPAPAADAAVPAKQMDEPHGLLAAAGAKPTAGKKPPQRSSNGPRMKKGSASNALSGTQKLASNLNKIISKVSQPFVAGHDMSTNAVIDVTDKALASITFNCMMKFPGSFRVELRTESKGKGELLASAGNVSAQASFGKVVVEFEDQVLYAFLLLFSFFFRLCFYLSSLFSFFLFLLLLPFSYFFVPLFFLLFPLFI